MIRAVVAAADSSEIADVRGEGVLQRPIAFVYRPPLRIVFALVLAGLLLATMPSGPARAQDAPAGSCDITRCDVSLERIRAAMVAERREGAGRAAFESLASWMEVSPAALAAFLSILRDNQVTNERMSSKLGEIARVQREAMERLAALRAVDPRAALPIEEAGRALAAGAHRRARELLGEAEAIELEAMHRGPEVQQAVAELRALSGRILLVRMDYPAAVERFRAALELMSGSDLPTRGRVRALLARTLYRWGEEKYSDKALADSVVAWREALEDHPRDRLPRDWAMMQNALGVALWRLGERRGDFRHFEEAATAYRAALQERSREREPFEWATSQDGLAQTLLVLARRQAGTMHLEEAVVALRAVLQVWTREQMPLQWAKAQDLLGLTLRNIAERGGAARLDEAAAAHRAALSERRRDRVPIDWASSMVNLGAALDAMGYRERSVVRMGEAASCYRDALQVFTRERMPVEWGKAQWGIANTLYVTSQLTRDRPMLEEAVATYRLALTALTAERAPVAYADLQRTLDTALQVLAKMR
jgi:tetratricopeptide (TPR) repeat protein